MIATEFPAGGKVPPTVALPHPWYRLSRRQVACRNRRIDQLARFAACCPHCEQVLQALQNDQETDR